MGRKLTKTQKAKNAAIYKQIKKEYAKTNKAIDYRSYKARVLARMEAEGMTARKAAKKEANTATFVNPGERSRNNIIQAAKNFDIYNDMKILSRDNKGRFVSVKDNLEWDKNIGKWVLKTISGNFILDTTNSPYGMTLVRSN